MTQFEGSRRMPLIIVAAILIGIVLSADTLGRYALSIGSDVSRWWRINSQSTNDLGLSPERRIVVPRGLVITFSVPANANWDAILWWVPGTTDGRVDH